MGKKDLWQSDYFDNRRRFADMINRSIFKGGHVMDAEELEIDEELKPFVTNHRLNIFDYHEHEDFSQFNTENKFLFELLKNSKDKDKTEEVIKKYLNDYSLDQESIKAIFGMLDIKADINKYKRETKERDTVCAKHGKIKRKAGDKKVNKKQ